ncbi:MAG: hypothetical protein Ta2F_03970 [Termitinemataceae bacterium]|nr:MAG: hypothetical protein Ta2F_03970 [Termitinemataceae bacterium]
MKHTKIIIMAAIIGLTCIGSVASHGHGRGGGRDSGAWDCGGRDHGTWDRGAWDNRHNTAAEAVTVNGTLQLIDGQIVVVSDNITYITRDIQRLNGFIEGLKEGAAVKVEGQASTVPLNANARFLRVSKLTVGGKDYTFPIR